MKKLKLFLKKYGLISILLVIIFLGTYFSFAYNIGFTPGANLNNQDWLSFWGSFLSFSGSLYLGYVAIKQNENIIQNERLEFEYEMKPIIQCYLKTYKTEDKKPLIVLVEENIGKTIAFNVQLNVIYPDNIKESCFAENALLLNKQTYTLPPKGKLSTPLCWTKNKYLLDDEKIIVSGTSEYYFNQNEKRKGIISQYTLTTKEMDLFDVINCVKENKENE